LSIPGPPPEKKIPRGTDLYCKVLDMKVHTLRSKQELFRELARLRSAGEPSVVNTFSSEGLDIHVAKFY
ncbi:unnamed protein product, partial [Amoebophrya sp. A120]